MFEWCALLRFRKLLNKDIRHSHLERKIDPLSVVAERIIVHTVYALQGLFLLCLASVQILVVMRIYKTSIILACLQPCLISLAAAVAAPTIAPNLNLTSASLLTLPHPLQ